MGVFLDSIISLDVFHTMLKNMKYTVNSFCERINATYGCPLHRSMDAACILEKTGGGTKIMDIFKSGRNINIINYICIAWSSSLISLTNFLAQSTAL